MFFCLFCVCTGCVLGLCTVFTVIPDARTGSVCVAAQWLGHLSFCLTFSAIIAKTYRIFAVFHNKSLKTAAAGKLHDRNLLIYIFVCVGVFVVYLSVWTSVARPVATPLYDSKEGVSFQCSSVDQSWPIPLFVVEGIMLLCGLVLAFRTRNVSSRFRETPFIVASVFVIVVVAVLVLLTAKFVQEDDLDVQFLFTGTRLRS